MISRILGVLSIAAFIGCGCSGPNRSGLPATLPLAGSGAGQRAGKAECLVCKRNADLACVDVEVDKDTPRLVHEGKTYFFCSDECREKFAQNPRKYADK